MIAFLEGILVEHEADSVIVNVGGVGYRLFVTKVDKEAGEKVRFYVSEVIREDRYDLFGFSSKDERDLFLILTDVQGVGPKLGQKIMRAASPQALRSHIQNSDVGFFTSISGVGKKTAQKIILDLKGVLVAVDEKGKPLPAEHADVTEALESLGYKKEQIVEILPHITGKSVEDRVKSALKMLAR